MLEMRGQQVGVRYFSFELRPPNESRLPSQANDAEAAFASGKIEKDRLAGERCR
jgi:hypothetical protein